MCSESRIVGRIDWEEANHQIARAKVNGQMRISELIGILTLQ